MRAALLLVTSVLVAGCGGQPSTPQTAPAPASGAPRAGAAEPNTVRYAPGTARYRVVQVQNARREMMGQVQETEATTTMVISVTVTPADAGNLSASYLLDSVTVTGAAEAVGPLESMRGKVFRVVFAPQGRMVTYTPPDTSAVTALGGDMFKDFMPTLPPGAATAGTTWVDTVSPPPTTAQGATVSTRSIRTHRVIGWETHEGARALHIATTGTYTVSGSGEQGGAQFTLAGTGHASSDRYISATGSYAGAAASDSSTILVSVPAAGLEIPIRQSRRTTLTRLP